jgi:uncharacterized protein YndB with AHSA1/START domain
MEPLPPFQFSLRTIFVAMLLAGVWLGVYRYVSIAREEARARQVPNNLQVWGGQPRPWRGVVEITRRFHASPTRVFKALTEADTLKRIFELSRVEVDPHVSGRFRFENDAVEALPGLHVVSGEYKDLEPGLRIVKSWVYEGPLSPDGKLELLLTIDLREIKPGVVELSLRQEGPELADDEKREEGRQGWSAALDILEEVLAE